MKICTKCGVEKEELYFYKCKAQKSGLKPSCKSCEAEYYRKYKQENPGVVEETKRRWVRNNRSRALEVQRNRRKRDAHKVKARSCVNHAVRDGRLLKPDSCSNCGKACNPEAHHHSYDESHWLDVAWYCTPCHVAEHERLKSINF